MLIILLSLQICVDALNRGNLTGQAAIPDIPGISGTSAILGIDGHEPNSSFTMIFTQDFFIPFFKSSELEIYERVNVSELNSNELSEGLIVRTRTGSDLGPMDFYSQTKSEVGILKLPDISDPATLVSLASMSSNAYVESRLGDGWIHVGSRYRHLRRFGWYQDGLRGHVFMDVSRKIVVLAFKGTSTQLTAGSRDTVDNDKYNDNLMFSCCCTANSYAWTDLVCDCESELYHCSNSCVAHELNKNNTYYQASLAMYRHVKQTYAWADIWITGHSLGGALASLVSQTYIAPAISFESPGELLSAGRLGLPSDQSSDELVFNIGNTADPIFMGVCNGPLAVCSIAGYALETGCHSGYECIYDTVKDNGTVLSIGYHRITAVIEIIKAYNRGPVCVRRECVDCYSWTMD
ncbi:Alpha/Beta hydrolase protein [Lipomyces oligophaga]|uniref:Alpha/Beta hydrolase protein n=1 Tax=Lipomyces oligophaga TaxID=45792 RepID=UPI0034CFC16F